MNNDNRTGVGSIPAREPMLINFDFDMYMISTRDQLTWLPTLFNKIEKYIV